MLQNTLQTSTIRHRGKTWKAMALLMLTLGIVGGCAPLKPWVKPYERNNLADPIMSFGRDPIEAGYMHHVYQAREGARGAEGGAGGGCGCN